MPPVALTGYINTPLAKAGELLANCATWQTLCVADDAAEAAGFIDYWDWTGEEADITRPTALVTWADDFLREGRSGGAGIGFVTRGTVVILLEVDVPEAYTDNLRDALVWWANQVGALEANMEALTGTGTYFAASEIKVSDVGQSETAQDVQFLHAIIALGIAI